MKKFTRSLLLAFFLSYVCCAVGCAKDTILGFANAVMTNLGDNVLTKGYNLHGRRTFGEDCYTGTYLAQYTDQTGREILFGNTAIERPGGNSVALSAVVNGSDGSGTLILERDGQDPEVLLSGTGTLDTVLDVCPGSAYLVFETSGFSGTVDLVLEDAGEET